MIRFDPIAGFKDGLRPEKYMTVSEWADSYRYLDISASPEPGRYRTSRTPYLRKIMDVLSSRANYQRIILMKSAQIGASEAGYNWLGYRMDVSPGPTLAVMPTEGQMKRNSKIRIGPMIQATPRLRAKMGTSKHKDSSNTLLEKTYAGGFLALSGANSASGLRSVPAECIMLDEVDGYPVDLEGEGSPVSLAEARSMTFKRRKIFIPSTPTRKGVSVIEKEYEETDKQKYHVPCPHCGSYQHLEWEQMRWQGDDPRNSPQTAYYECKDCKEHILEEHKLEILEKGEWIATDPDKTDSQVIGFHINALISPFFSFADVVKKYLTIYNDHNKLVTFNNTILGIPSEGVSTAPKWMDLYNRAKERPLNKPPKDVKLITAGVDVQKDRLEVQIVGWGYKRRRWVIDYRVLYGQTNDDENVWKELDGVINEVFTREDGLNMPIKFTAIDAGNNPKPIYNFCKNYPRTRVAAVKGGSAKQSVIFNQPTPVDKTPTGKGIAGVLLYTLGVNMLKSEFYGNLKLEKLDEDELGPAGYVHLPKLGENYFKGLVAEEEIEKLVKGFPVYEWHKVNFERNEPLDTMVYARAAASITGLDRYDDSWLDAIEDSYVEKSVKTTLPPVQDSLTNNGGSIWD